MKKLSTLLFQRQALLEQARLANLAFAYETLDGFAQRIARAQLRGAVILKAAAPEEDCFCPTLTPLEISPAVIEEHFTDGDILELADVIGFVNAQDRVNVTFRLEEITETFLEPLRADLERRGVRIDHTTSALREPQQS